MVSKPEIIMITGASGFIGSHAVNFFLKNSNFDIVALVRNSNVGSLNRLENINALNNPRVRVIWKNLRDTFTGDDFFTIGRVNYILHFAASSHVDRSIKNPLSFVLDNVIGTCNLLEYFRVFTHEAKFVYFSTDEVFGSAEESIAYKEWDRYKSGNPYAATKAGAEELCLAYCNTYKLNIAITHTMNVFGEQQSLEKFIPLCVNKILNREKIKIHANKDCTKSGSRFYIYAQRVCEALDFILKNWKTGDKFNIVGEKEISNLDLALLIGEYLNVGVNYELVDFHSSRPGHDLRYALDGTKLKNLGFSYSSTFEEDLERTIMYYEKLFRFKSS